MLSLKDQVGWTLKQIYQDGGLAPDAGQETCLQICRFLIAQLGSIFLKINILIIIM